ncbi:hypothetical protein [Nocardia tengchongensis]|uniref:hypothetical protein n=1 Tax=Nocardia tengchongensis TaxID=2055889 RepID=UPI00361AD226
MSQSSTLSLSELSTVELEKLLNQATPALRSAVQRGLNGKRDNVNLPFNSFIDTEIAE